MGSQFSADRSSVAAESLPLPPCAIYTAHGRHGAAQIHVDADSIAIPYDDVELRLRWSDIRSIERGRAAIELADSSRRYVLRVPNNLEGHEALLATIEERITALYRSRVRPSAPRPRDTMVLQRSRRLAMSALGGGVALTIAAAWFNLAVWACGLVALVTAVVCLARVTERITVGPDRIEMIAPVATRTILARSVTAVNFRILPKRGPVVLVSTTDNTTIELPVFGDRAIALYDRIRQVMEPSDALEKAPPGQNSKLGDQPALKPIVAALTAVVCLLVLPIFSGRALQSAATDGPAWAVKAVLNLGGRIDGRDFEGHNALYNAAKTGRSDIVKLLLDRKANARAQSHTVAGDTPLHVAAKFDRLEVVRALLAAGVDPNIQNATKQTPLMQLALAGKRQPSEMAIVDVLLAAHADVNLQDKDGLSAIHLAAIHQRVALIQALVKHGARLDLRTVTGATPLALAIVGRHWDVVDALVAGGGDINERKELDGTWLNWAVAENDTDRVRRLLTYGARTDISGDDEYLPLEQAVNRDQLEVLQLLLAAGANPNVVRPGHMPPLHLAASRGYDRIAAELVAAGADVRRVHEGWTPLRIAQYRRHTAVQHVLLEGGATQ
jgi:ankyrin repeat protein